MNRRSTYKEIKPSRQLNDFIHSFWSHENKEDTHQKLTISPDSFFKIVFLIQDNSIVNYFITGIWTENKDFIVPPRTTAFGCRFKILAPEFLLDQEVASMINGLKQLDLSYLNLKSFSLSDFDLIVKQWEAELSRLKPNKMIPPNKMRLSQILYSTNDGLSTSEVSNQIHWSNRQINRYLNKYVGVSLKKYLNIRKIYASYRQIREGELYPQNDYFDQAHFIREVKKHTGETPKSLFLKQNDHFIQLKNIQDK